MEFKNDTIKWSWADSYTTTTTTGEPIEIKAPAWKIGDKVEINSPTYTAPMAYGWVCPRCGRVNAPWASQCGCSGSMFVKINTPPEFKASPCASCSTNPANGGSGNCNCILGTPQVTC